MMEKEWTGKETLLEKETLPEREALPEKDDTAKQEKTAYEETIRLEESLPSEIERKSFEIITRELGERRFPVGEDLVVKRVIHTTADFEYADTLVFSEGAVAKALEALRAGASIVTDTNMAKSGINKRALSSLGGQVYCFMADPDVAAQAKARGTTRAAVSMEKAASLGEDFIFAIGNAPTALVRLYELIREGKISPKLIIGAPVGFVNVEASKELILSLHDTPSIVARGRKGGSGVAAAICNALLYQVAGRE